MNKNIPFFLIAWLRKPQVITPDFGNIFYINKVMNIKKNSLLTIIAFTCFSLAACNGGGGGGGDTTGGNTGGNTGGGTTVTAPSSISGKTATFHTYSVSYATGEVTTNRTFTIKFSGTSATCTINHYGATSYTNTATGSYTYSRSGQNATINITGLTFTNAVHKAIKLTLKFSTLSNLATGSATFTNNSTTTPTTTASGIAVTFS